MIVCPKCKNKISTIKLLSLNIIQCESCLSYLIQKPQRKFNILLIIIFPVIGALFGAFLGKGLFVSGELLYLLLIPFFILLLFLAALGATTLIIKLEVTEPPRRAQSPTPPPFNMS